MKVALIGYGVEGQSALTYWQTKGADITVCDANKNLELPSGVTAQLGPDYLHNLDRFDLIVRTAGLNPGLILAQNPGTEAKITTLINEFLAVCPTKNVIGITGTKGKGTTSTLTAKMLEAAGHTVFLGGNIGIPPFDFLPQITPDSWVVLELSSFQTYDVQHSPRIAVCLMMAPEHLNWHSDMEDYIQAKSQLFAHQTPKDVAIYFAGDKISQRIASHSPGTKISYFAEPGAHLEDDTIVIEGQKICLVGELKLLGAHNWQNVCAAVTAVWQATHDVAAMRSVLTTFSGLPYRLEFVREVDGVKYYNDSFGTTPETAIVAIEAFSQPKVVILGGSDKGSVYGGLAQAVKRGNVRQALLIGRMGPVIGRELQSAGFTAIIPGGSSMTEIVAKARAAAQPGDVVLLSTACASFGMFRDYKDRGAQFKAAVTAL